MSIVSQDSINILNNLIRVSARVSVGRGERIERIPPLPPPANKVKIKKMKKEGIDHRTYLEKKHALK